MIASALVSGVFLSFSDFVMRSLDKAGKQAGIESMQIINREVYKTLFMALLVGMAAISVVLIYMAWSSGGGVAAYWQMGGGVIYLLVTFAVTIFGNVPLNEELDSQICTHADTGIYWSTIFYPRWILFNHIRTAGAVASACCFLFACLNYKSV